MRRISSFSVQVQQVVSIRIEFQVVTRRRRRAPP